MGFHYPVTTETDIDTRTTITTPGMYTTESVDGAGNTTMVVHLSDGFGSDADATVTRTASVNPRAQAQSQSGGTAVGGGSYAGTTAPHAEYNVELQGDGSHLAVARLVAATQYDLGGAKLTGLGAGSLDDTGWLAVPSLSAGWSFGTDGINYRRMGGAVYFQSHVLGSGNGQLYQLPAGYRPTRAHWWIPEWGGAAVGELKLTTDGWFTVSNHSAAGFVVSGCFPVG